MPRDLTPTQAWRAAHELQGAFNHHELMNTRRDIRARNSPPNFESLGITPELLQTIEWQSEEPNQEAMRYATAFAAAYPEVRVFGESDKPNTVKKMEELEAIYNGMIKQLIPDFYPYDLHVSADGVVALRLDLKQPFWRGVRARDTKNKEPSADYNIAVDNHRKVMGLPIEASLVHPSAFYYDEDKSRSRVTLGVEIGQRRISPLKAFYEKAGKKRRGTEKWLNPTMPSSDSTYGGSTVEFVAIRTPHVIYHMIAGSKSGGEPEVLWEGPNPFVLEGEPHTGFILWRGRYTGFSDPERKYDPYNLASINNAQMRNLFVSLQAEFGILASQMWIEAETDKAGPTVGRAISKVAKGAGTSKRMEKGAAAAQLAEGESLKWREVAGDMKYVLEVLAAEEERNAFSDALMGDAAANATGRAIIRLQEAAGRLLGQGFKAKAQATEELLNVVRDTIFNKKSLFLANERKIYVPVLSRGQGPRGNINTKDLLTFGAEHEVPHTIEVVVGSQSQAANLALIEEGIAIAAAGQLPQDVIDTEYYQVKDLTSLNRMRIKDQIRATAIPLTIKRAGEDIMAIIEARTPPNEAVFLPDDGGAPQEIKAPKGTGAGGGGGGQSGGQPPGISGRPGPPKPEDVALASRGGPGPRTVEAQ
ncbi:MAG: hypothetical protein QQN63_04830 [Nitrosopumilus sp.]